MGEFKKTAVCDSCYTLRACINLDRRVCEHAERLEAVRLPIMTKGFKKRIMRVVDK